MPKFKIIVNPLAGRGYAAKAAPIIRQKFNALGADFDLVQTSAAGEAIRLAREALDAGFDTIVAVGGDGTSHEVVNGMMAHSNGQVVGTLGCIPAGSGNDFATMAGAPTDLDAACQLIVAGSTRVLDIGQVRLDDCIVRYFDNAVGVGFDGLVTMETRKAKHLRGMALYLPVVLKTIFLSMRPPRAEITFDGQTIRKTTLMTVIANGPREGGGFLVAPDAKCDDGLFDLMIADTMPKLGMLAMIPRFMKGTHVGHPLVSIQHVKDVSVRSEDPLYVHVDGEILCDEAHEVEIKMIPGCLRMIAPQMGSGC
jgi:diacylglycerol kinase (ATP)